MARRRNSNRRRRRGGARFLYKLVSMLVICGAIVAALTLFFRVDTVVVTGLSRYTAQEVQDAAGIRDGDNLLLFNKYDMAPRIVSALPYIEEVRINRKLPDTLLIEVRECRRPFALVQGGSAWLISPRGRGKIVDQVDAEEASAYPQISGCELLSPSVGTQIAMATEFSTRQESLLSLLSALEEADMLDQVDGVRLDDAACIRMDYAGRFTVQMLYGADYARKLRALSLYLADEKIQDNMTGTFDLTRDDKNYFRQEVR